MRVSHHYKKTHICYRVINFHQFFLNTCICTKRQKHPKKKINYANNKDSIMEEQVSLLSQLWPPTNPLYSSSSPFPNNTEVTHSLTHRVTTPQPHTLTNYNWMTMLCVSLNWRFKTKKRNPRFYKNLNLIQIHGFFIHNFTFLFYIHPSYFINQLRDVPKLLFLFYFIGLGKETR